MGTVIVPAFHTEGIGDTPSMICNLYTRVQEVVSGGILDGKFQISWKNGNEGCLAEVRTIEVKNGMIERNSLAKDVREATEKIIKEKD